ncbi:MAG: hypothetical protein K6F56_04585 [Oscillospiraceae bacterium]|nr:hypothetical protein [Oscillospiraceae bacterium]
MQKTPSRIRVCFLLLLAACLLLSGCGKQGDGQQTQGETPSDGSIVIGGQMVDPNVSSLTAVMNDGETAQLDKLPNLRFLDLRGSANAAEIAAWAEAHPDVDVSFSVTLPDGSVLDSDAYTADLSAMNAEQIRQAAELLALLPELRSVDLGDESNKLGMDDIDAIRALLPGAALHWTFTLYGKEFDLDDSVLNLRYIKVKDNGAAVREVMGHMPNLRTVDMDSCGLSNEVLEKLNQDFPDAKVIWRINFGEKYSVRTDVEMILASRPSEGGILHNDDVAQLYYCHDVKYLDIGHSGAVTDISFIRGMPKLEVAIVGMCSWSDGSPLADCPNLEYLEMFDTECEDLSPLAGLKNLRHLNIATNMKIRDMTCLYGLTELERLWIGQMTGIPREQIDEMRRLNPKCEINTWVWQDPTTDHWRYNDWEFTDRYALLRVQFGGYTDKAFSFYYNDPLYPKDEEGVA